MTRVLVIALVLAGCYEQPSTTCTIRCTPSNPTSCPDGLTCNSAGLCSTDGAACTAPSIDFLDVQPGGRHVCGLATNGDIYCWGGNDVGQIGAGTMGDPVTTLTKVAGDHGPYTQLAVGSEHTCALDSEGRPWCWGQNKDGQVHGAGPAPFSSPTSVLGSQAPAFDHITAGGPMTCALGNRQLWCWGTKEFTNGTPESQLTRVGTVDDWTSIDAGLDHVCGISESSGVLCLGFDGYRQLGTPMGTSSTPVAVPGLPTGKTPIDIVSGVQISCAILGDTGATAGELWCWGRNSFGLVVIDSSGLDQSPTRIGTDADWTEIRLGHFIACGKRAGTWRCWGQSYNGAIPTGLWSLGAFQVDTAYDIGAADDLTLQSQGGDGDDVDLLCMRTGTKVSCSGDNGYGGLANGQYTRHGTPVEIAAPGGHTWKHMNAGRYHTCATTDDDSLLCWGSTTDGAANAGIALGGQKPCVDGEVCDLAIPTALPAPLLRADELVANDAHGCARDGAMVHCWGADYRGYLGATSPTGISTVVAPAGATWTSLFGGETATCGATSAGNVACWGWIAGVNTSPPTTLPIASVTGGGFGNGFACITDLSNARKCWGVNDYGQLGAGDQTARSIGNLYTAGGVTSVSSAADHSCVITTAGAVHCYGSNFYLESGTPNSGGFEPTPVTVHSGAGDLATCTQVSAGNNTSCALCAGQVYCWGGNYQAQLGRGIAEGGPDEVAALVQLPATETFKEMSIGEHHGCALSMTGRLFCWGDSDHGQIGNGAQSRNLLQPIAP